MIVRLVALALFVLAIIALIGFARTYTQPEPTPGPIITTLVTDGPKIKIP